MPRYTERQQYLRELEQMLAWNVQLSPSKTNLERSNAIALELERVERSRYLDRPQTYKRNTTTHALILGILEDYESTRKHFRLSPAEFWRLVELVGRYPVFHHGALTPKPQVHPYIQLAVFLYRLSHGTSYTGLEHVFKLSHGSAVHYCRRAATALAGLLPQVVVWPSPEERSKHARIVRELWGLPDCVGFIDGVHVILDKAPAMGKDRSSRYFTRKGHYGLFMLAVCDVNKRFTYVHFGLNGGASDATAQNECSLHTQPEQFFSRNEWVLGDAGITCTQNIVSMYRRGSKGFRKRQVRPGKHARSLCRRVEEC